METINTPAPPIPRKIDWLKIGLMVLPTSPTIVEEKTSFTLEYSENK